jgi:hypothetical protein
VHLGDEAPVFATIYYPDEVSGSVEIIEFRSVIRPSDLD